MNILICSQCSKAIRKNQNGIYCNNSNHWLHVNCTNLTNEEFKLLCKQDDDNLWCCNHCILDVLPFRNVTNSEFLERHQFCSKKNLIFSLTLVNSMSYLLTIVSNYLMLMTLITMIFLIFPIIFQKTQKIL